ncbi:metallopeptidase family protein [Arsenicicoccus dermatophilus]|uniref:metallopeptidase family protein n=1 Tax=Arsenicicoccus dermatophilus TaxID=1076331 RepID=UPI003916E3D8
MPDVSTPPAESPCAGPARRLSRDRRGRGRRGPLAWPPVPEMLTRADRFDQFVLEAVDRIAPRADGRLDGVEVAVELVPTDDVLRTCEQEGTVPLGNARPGDGSRRPRIVVYRRPVESRACGSTELEQLVDLVVVEQAAALLMVSPEDLDPGYDPDLG